MFLEVIEGVNGEVAKVAEYMEPRYGRREKEAR